jgi:hypothetical protein
MHRIACSNTRRPAGEPHSAPRFAEWRRRLIAAEQGAGWLDRCDDSGHFVIVSRELIAALADTLRALAGQGPVLEVCAGRGELARGLAAVGVPVQATDRAPTAGSAVSRLSAQQALDRFQPACVLGAFVPHDAGVDEAVLACRSVRHYLILNARVGNCLGSPSLWTATRWRAEPVASITRWMLTRHDCWLPDRAPGGDVLQHGEAWLFTADAPSGVPV